MRLFVASLLTAVFVGILFVVWQGFQFMTTGASSDPSDRVFEVLPGEGFYRVADRLQTEGLITSALKFKILAKLSGRADSLRVGEYAVKASLKPYELLAVLSSGKSIERQFTIPEGWNIYDIARLLEQKGLGDAKKIVAMARDPKLVKELLGEEPVSLEGYLYPETYKYTKYTSVESILRGMVSRFNEVYAQLGYDSARGFSKHQLVTLASVIEKETGAPEERPLISSVFHNRLRKGMRLQSDPTIIYGILMETGVEKQNITRDDITRPTRYNTYTVPALPYGPIANPGREALAAAMSPAESNYFFFVSKNDGTHTFSESLADHNAAVRKFQLDRRAREGKSWRDLKNRDKAASQ